MKLWLALTLSAGFFLGSYPARAHHSFAAEYDASKTIVITGKVTKVEFINPHAWIYVQAAGADGKIEEWACEFGPPNDLYRNGWNKNSVKAGDTVTIGGALAKNGSPTINASNITTAEGRRLFAGSSQGNNPSQGNNQDK